MYSKCKAVIANPFSSSTNQPKIPDGKAPASMGGKRHMITTVDFGETNTMDIIISPRFDSPIYFASAEREGATAAPKVEGKIAFNDNHPFAKAWSTNDSLTTIKANTAAEISKIRLVSQGTKITLTNSTDDNDGWFEAFRFTPGKDGQLYVTDDGTSGAVTPYSLLAWPNPTMFGNRVATAAETFNMNLASKSNYVTGKLRSLSRYTWVNKPMTKDVDFKDLGTTMLVGAQAPAAIDQQASIAFQDWDYDVIWIRIHGRGIPTAQQGGCCLPTKLMVHLVQNLECVFGEQNTLHSFMTKSPVTGSFRRAGSSLPYMPMRRYYMPYRRAARRTYARKRTTAVSKRRYTRKKY